MGLKDREIFPNNANFLTAQPAGHPEGGDFVVVSIETAEGIDQLAFSTEESEKLLGGLIESLASQQNPLGQMLLDALQSATEGHDEEATEEAGSQEVGADDEGEEGDDEEGDDDLDLDIAGAIDPTDATGDDFGPDA